MKEAQGWSHSNWEQDRWAGIPPFHRFLCSISYSEMQRDREKIQVAFYFFNFWKWGKRATPLHPNMWNVRSWSPPGVDTQNWQTQSHPPQERPALLPESLAGSAPSRCLTGEQVRFPHLIPPAVAPGGNTGWAAIRVLICNYSAWLLGKRPRRRSLDTATVLSERRWQWPAGKVLGLLCSFYFSSFLKSIVLSSRKSILF